MSLDGFIAGPNQGLEHPLGVGGDRLHEWAYPLRAFKEMHGKEGGEVNASNAIIENAFKDIGASIMGRNMFGGYPGPWDARQPWNGWWGTKPPFGHPVYVLTHHPRQPLAFDNGTTFTFVTDGFQSALEQARKAAGTKDVGLGGGANAAQQFLTAGLVDEMLISLVPILLGGGKRLFDGVGGDLHGLGLIRTVPAPDVVHLIFERR